MIFIGGVSSKREKLDFNQTMVCPHCGRYGSYEVYMEYMHFSFFFIPIYKWNKKFYVQSTCCGSIYSISKELGLRIAEGESIIITEKDLNIIQKSNAPYRCPHCNYEINEDFKFCPNCAAPLK
jgi:hypothetical protein